MAATVPSTWDELQAHRLHRLPSTAFYVADFITEQEAAFLLKNLSSPALRWTSLQSRRVCNLGGCVTPNGLLSAPFPSFLRTVCSRLSQLDLYSKAAVKAPNHCLVNEYLPGQGIMMHEDGPLYYPLVSIVSLCSPIIFKFQEKRSRLDCDGHSSDVSKHSYSLLLEKNSLLIFNDSLYSEHLHGIDALEEDSIDQTVVNAGRIDGYSLGDKIQRRPRYSLTLRVVDKVMPSRLIFGRTRT